MTKLRLTRKHVSGSVKLYDRKPKLDEKGKPVEGKFVEVVHRLTPEACPKYNKAGKMLEPGKAFQVNDVEYVLKRHGAILEKAE